MRISCVSKTAELGNERSDIVVFPEYADSTEVSECASRYPDSVIVAAIRQRRQSVARVLHRGDNHVRYVKVDSDGDTDGCGDLRQRNVCEFGSLCVGVLICMDIQMNDLLLSTLATIRQRRAEAKALCIPASMSSDWLSALPLPVRYEGLWVVLSNNPDYRGVRRKSFICAPDRTIVQLQQDREAIHWTV